MYFYIYFNNCPTFRLLYSFRGFGRLSGLENAMKSCEELINVQEVYSNFQKENLPNVNVPERIIICLDVCFDNPNSLYKLQDGTTYTPINMMKRVLDFFIHTKHAINRLTEFAIMSLNDEDVSWELDFTNNLKDVFNSLDCIRAKESTSDNFDFSKVLEILKQKVQIPEYKQEDSILPPPFVVRMIVMYCRSNCFPKIPTDDAYLNFLKKQPYFYTDILLAHEKDCPLYKCNHIYDALQDLDNGYSYVFEVTKNACKVHNCIAKLLAHPLQRPLQKNADYRFGSKPDNTHY